MLGLQCRGVKEDGDHGVAVCDNFILCLQQLVHCLKAGAVSTFGGVTNLQGFRRMISFLTAAVKIADRFNFSLFVEAPERPRLSVTSSNALSSFISRAAAMYWIPADRLTERVQQDKNNIVRVDVFEGYKSDLIIYCKKQ